MNDKKKFIKPIFRYLYLKNERVRIKELDNASQEYHQSGAYEHHDIPFVLYRKMEEEEQWQKMKTYKYKLIQQAIKEGKLMFNK